jgi:hypothetical protein
VNDSDDGIENKREVMKGIGGEIVVLKRHAGYSTSALIGVS